MAARYLSGYADDWWLIAWHMMRAGRVFIQIIVKLSASQTCTPLMEIIISANIRGVYNLPLICTHNEQKHLPFTGKLIKHADLIHCEYQAQLSRICFALNQKSNTLTKKLINYYFMHT